MKTLTRQDVKKAFKEIVSKFGEPTRGEIYCEDHLVSAIAHDLCCYGETNITFENGKFDVSPSLSITNTYAPDHTFVGTVKAKEWYTDEQLKALHEVGFGYMF